MKLLEDTNYQYNYVDAIKTELDREDVLRPSFKIEIDVSDSDSSEVVV